MERWRVRHLGLVFALADGFMGGNNIDILRNSDEMYD